MMFDQEIARILRETPDPTQATLALIAAFEAANNVGFGSEFISSLASKLAFELAVRRARSVQGA